MQRKVIIAAVSISFFLGACNQKQSNGEAEKATQQEANAHSTDNNIAPSRQIIRAYLKVKDALVESDAGKAGEAAMNLVQLLDEENALIKKIKFDAEQIAENQDVSPQRDHFNTLSDNIFKMAKTTPGLDGTLYRQYCPMAFDNKGAYWLSSEEQIRNPYFGDRMLKCGRVEEKL